MPAAHTETHGKRLQTHTHGWKCPRSSGSTFGRELKGPFDAGRLWQGRSCQTGVSRGGWGLKERSSPPEVGRPMLWALPPSLGPQPTWAVIPAPPAPAPGGRRGWCPCWEGSPQTPRPRCPVSTEKSDAVRARAGSKLGRRGRMWRRQLNPRFWGSLGVTQWAPLCMGRGGQRQEDFPAPLPHSSPNLVQD